jgi:hypothetical protein
MASASPNVRVGWVPAPILTPPEVVEPGRTIRRLLPMLAICSEILLLAPVPTASIVMTAPTPIMIPSIVRAERILFTFNALNDIRNVEGMLIMTFPPVQQKGYILFLIVQTAFIPSITN